MDEIVKKLKISEKLCKNIVQTLDVRFKKKISCFLVTEDCELMELNECEQVINYVNLKSYDKKSTFSKIASSNIQVQKFETVNYALYLLVKINDTLLTIERRPREFKFLNIYYDVNSFETEPKNQNILIVFNDLETKTVTFTDESVEESRFKENNHEAFREIEG
jgi:hypothetical protein